MNIVVHSKTGCPSCDAAKNHLDARGIAYAIFTHDKQDDRNDIYDRFELVGSKRTMPQIIVDGVRIGGWDELKVHPQLGLTISELTGSVGLLTQRVGYKPLKYPWAHDMWKKQQQVHWMPEEVPMGPDVNDWQNNLTDAERNLLMQIFRFFTQADIEVQDNYMERYGRVFKPTEVKMMLAAFANMETIHIDAYALLLETIGMPESEFGAFLEYEALRDKHDYMGQFGVETPADVARTMAMFGGFSEGLQLFASFAMLMNFPRHNKMKGMGQIVSWSIRDESLHCEGIIKLYHTFNQETGAVTKSVADDIIDCCKTVIDMEDKFIDLAFELGGVEGMQPEDIKAYTRFIADWRLRQLKLTPIYGTNQKENPLPWLQPLLSGVEHANFFEARATEYSKAATQGSWDGDEGVWAEFDKMMFARSNG